MWLIGLDEHINKFLSMFATMHMACGLEEHTKKYLNLITQSIFHDLYVTYMV
jgi:hypothetical protein